MIYEAENLNGSIITFKNPISVQLNMDEDAPADSLKAQFALNAGAQDYKLIANDQLAKIKVYDDKKQRLIFNGLIDEQTASISGNGVAVKIIARSTAALLLDNEARPQVYNSMSADILYRRHMKPYGFTGYNCSNNKRYSGLFEVNKGLSEWQVIEKFCGDFMLKIPRVRSSNIIDFLDGYKDSGIVFSNRIKSALHYSSIEQSYKRFKLISEVFVRNLKDGGYDTRIADKISIDKGIQRKRYINAIGDIKSPVFRGEQLIKDAKETAFEVKLTYPGGVEPELFDKVTVDDEIFGVMPDLITSSINYKLNSLSETCDITFRREG